ncbi:hypothetical protein NQ314_002493 [Rhamnusium bicolor]|uniref:Uncharacterized protein n=1 Tax=Rhamnusium bicolor TaxID=1586634 RepID=A0AAV8ZQQ1_9CUCU|nr:hypothetical protein NQ314_002493 [Rhamnusium bicolor]
MQNLQENLRKHVLSTNKHPGKCIYECKFCTEDHFQSNFAKEFKAHLITRHSEMFGNGAEAATYVAGIYDVQDDSTYVDDTADIDQTHERNVVPQTTKIDDTNENILKLKTHDDPIVSQLSANVSSTSEQTPKDRTLDQMLPMFIIPKDEAVTVENLPDTWNLVGRYDVEEESGTLIPFQNDGESLFQEHFQ